jgi:transposase
MAIDLDTVDCLGAKFSSLLEHLDERAARLYLGSEARSLGHGGIAAVARAAGVSRQTVAAGVAELEAGDGRSWRVRRPGGGRKRLVELDPGLRSALLALVEPGERGDPMTPLRWTTKSTRRLATELTKAGHRVSADTVGVLLREEGFSLQANAKTLEGSQHPDRDAQFRYLAGQVTEYQTTGQPVISVDAKKKELIGPFANNGRQWRPAGRPERVNVHDFADPVLGKAIPYGVYDLQANTGWVNVGCDHDTAAFAVESIRRWWNDQGRHTYPAARRLLITADAGGSNGYRTRAWKLELATLAAQTGLTITVCHLPPGTSKWNKIEHRLFSHITTNWRGRRLTSHEVVLASISTTTTATGLRVHAQLDTGTYPTGTTISATDLAGLPLTRHTFHGDWNYVLHPGLPAAPDIIDLYKNVNTDSHADWWNPAMLADPGLTGMTSDALHALTSALALLPDAAAPTRGGRPWRLAFADQVLATVLHHHTALPARPLAVLFNTSHAAMHRVLTRITRLLQQHGTTIPPATRPPAALAALRDRVEAQSTPPADPEYAS